MEQVMGSKLDELCQPLFEHANKVLSRDVNKSGQRLYDHWCRRTRKECFMASYQNEFFRAAYCMNRLGTSARSYVQAVSKIRHEAPQFMTFLKSVRSVISIGCGPGSDAVGLLAFLHENQCGPSLNDRRLVFYMVDQCSEWADYIAALDASVANSGCSLWFKQLRFKEVGNEAWLPPADMIVFSFANTALMDPAVWPLLVRRYRMVLVLDSVRETLKDEYDDCKFSSFQLNDRTRCYYRCVDGFGHDADAADVDAAAADDAGDAAVVDSDPQDEKENEQSDSAAAAAAAAAGAACE